MHANRSVRVPPVSQLVWLVVAVMVLAPGLRSRSEYCGECGLRRYTEAMTFVGLPLHQKSTYRTGPYTRLYNKVAPMHAKHEWRRYGYGWIQGAFGILGAGVGCGSPPPIIRGGKDAYLTSLQDLDGPELSRKLKSFQNKDGRLKY
jgi:hypothetical protein